VGAGGGSSTALFLVERNRFVNLPVRQCVAGFFGSNRGVLQEMNEKQSNGKSSRSMFPTLAGFPDGTILIVIAHSPSRVERSST